LLWWCSLLTVWSQSCISPSHHPDIKTRFQVHLQKVMVIHYDEDWVQLATNLQAVVHAQFVSIFTSRL
jgi:hypothetical protein